MGLKPGFIEEKICIVVYILNFLTSCIIMVATKVRPKMVLQIKSPSPKTWESMSCWLHCLLSPKEYSQIGTLASVDQAKTIINHANVHDWYTLLQLCPILARTS